MNKEDVINSINDHIKKFGKILGYKSYSHVDELNWIKNYFEHTILYNDKNDKKIHLEQIWVLMHNDYVHHCPICNKIPQFRNYNVGYSNHCKTCGQLLGSKKSAQLKKDNSPEIIITKKCKNCEIEFSYKSRKLNNTIGYTFCSKHCSGHYNQTHLSDESLKSKYKNANKTNLEKYGNKWVVNSKYTRDITKQKLGVEYPFMRKDIYEKTKVTLYNNTGYTNPFKNPDTIKKMMKTKMDRYGDFLLPMAKYKEYTMPSGTKVKVQGNEPKALNILVTKYKEDDIIIGRSNIEKYTGKIYYIKNGEKHIYYPDIYIKSVNKIYEIKSQFTYDIHKNINELKKRACIELNLDFEFMIIN